MSSDNVNEITNECVIDSTPDVEPTETIERSETDQPRRRIERKPVKNLTEEEKQSLINDARAGRDSSDYNVKFFKNGNVHITQKKFTKSQHLIAAQGEPTNDSRGRPILTNDQLLMEHIIDLESKFTKMTMKHKKLKKRYAELESNIYYEDNAEPDNEPVTEPVREPINEPVNEPVREPINEPPTAVAQGRRKGWRSRFM